MGSSVTIVTAIASMAPGITIYCPPVQSAYPWYINSPLYVICTQQPLLANGGSFAYTGILQGAMFGFEFDNAVQDGDTDSIYNITSGDITSGSSGTAYATCTTTATSNTCSTPLTFVMTGNPYELETFASLEKNKTDGTQDSAYNYSIIVLPPVPAQPAMSIQGVDVNTGGLLVRASPYSTEYGSQLTGCLLHYGQTPYNPSSSNIPTLLTSTTGLPSNAVGYFSFVQNATSVVTPASFPNPPVTQVAYDYHFSCYNGNGPSPEVILYNISVNTNNTGKNSAASLYQTSSTASMVVAFIGLTMAAVTLLA